MKADFVRQLRRLARLNGILPSFVDAAGRRRTASPEALSALLSAFGVPADGKTEVRDGLHHTLLRPYRQGIEPVFVMWENHPRRINFYLPAKLAGKAVQSRLHFEDGRVEESGLALRALRTNSVAGERFVEMQLSLPSLPFGYHTLELVMDHTVRRALILSAPVRSYAESGAGKRRGVFLPMYAAHSEQSWGAGNFSDWDRFSEWIASSGATVAATLPLLAAFLDYPVCEPSPYSPASRLFWNEFYLDVTRVPEFTLCRPAQLLVRSAEFQRRLRAFQASELIDYQAQWKLRRRVLELLAEEFFAEKTPRRAAFERFLLERPEVEDYAAFRAACDKLKTSWHTWPQHMRAGTLRKCNFDEPTKKFHLYIQWLAHDQLDELVRYSEHNGVKFYLDLPLGVNPDGYDVWRERDSFALEAAAGAPPDLFFTKGQNWGFAPLHPHRIRESGYRYVRAVLRFHMRHARLLRIDHVMGLHRLYWVPRGFEAARGTYVNYLSNELQAIFNLESHRNRTLLVGENLGTVPKVVNQSMRRNRVREMFVVQFEERPDPKAALRPPPAMSVSSLNTHDTPTFAAHWRGEDLRDCLRLELLTRFEFNEAIKRRERLKTALIRFLTREGFLTAHIPAVRDVLRALLAWLKASASELVLLNLEDLWLEIRPQNVPGTSTERPNWRRKAHFKLERIFQERTVFKVLAR